MISEAKRKDLEKQGYRIVGNHSAIKVCMWTKRAIKAQDVCYKNTFYGINTHQCVQMTPALHTCTHRCMWCWRDIDFTSPNWTGPVDEPKTIVDGCIKAHVEYLKGFGGNKDTDTDRYAEAKKPRHFAISLSGEPTMYPKLPEFIDELHSQGITSFLVTNGTFPEMIEKLKAHEPTQLYVTFPAPDKETYIKVCSPLVKDGWEKILQTLKLLGELSCRKTIRLTLAKEVNMINPEKYADILKDVDADFFELKGYVWVGYSRERLEKENMPTHEEIVDFAKKIAAVAGFKIIDEKKNSRVALLMRTDKKDRVMKFN